MHATVFSSHTALSFSMCFGCGKPRNLEHWTHQCEFSTESRWILELLFLSCMITRNTERFPSRNVGGFSESRRQVLHMRDMPLSIRETRCTFHSRGFQLDETGAFAVSCLLGHLSPPLLWGAPTVSVVITTSSFHVLAYFLWTSKHGPCVVRNWGIVRLV